MEQKPTRRPTHAEEEELAAITREIHAQLRASYAAASPAPVAKRALPATPPGADTRAATARFLSAFLIPPILMIGLAMLLRYIVEG